MVREVRPPQAGLMGFYPVRKNQLIKMLEECFLDDVWGPGAKPVPSSVSTVVYGGIAPHAGYTYSGPCAAHLYKLIGDSGRRYDTVVVLGTNHTGFGGVINTTKRYVWSTPLGNVDIDEDFIDVLIKSSRLVMDEPLAILEEHSVEVQLPFLQYVLGNEFKLVPLVLKWLNTNEARDLASIIYRVGKDLGRDLLVIASSDFTHHGPMYGYILYYENVGKKVKELDMKFIEKILNLDTEGFLNELRRYRATVCGPGPIATLIEYTKLVGGKPELLKYYNSAELTKDESAAVGYAAIIIKTS